MLFKKKVAKHDFDETQLPANRRQSIIDIIKNRWSTLIGIGFILFVFAIPLVVHQMILHVSVYEINLALEEGVISKEDAAHALFRTFNASYLITIPLLMILGIALAGSLRIMRQLIFQESVFFFHDFKKGIRLHAFTVLVSLFAIGVSGGLAQFVIRDAYFRTENSFVTLSVSLSIVAFLLIFLLAFFIICQAVLYVLPFFGLMKNAFNLAMRTFLPSMGVLILVFMPWLLLFIPYTLGYLLVLVLLFVLVLPLELLVLTEYAFELFDRFINKHHYPEIYRKGIWTDEKTHD